MAAFIRNQVPIPVDEISEEDHECFICTTKYGQRRTDGTSNTIEYAVQLPCKHIYGSQCLEQWISTSNKCPTCRRELFPEPRAGLKAITIAELETELLARFDKERAPTTDEVDEIESTGRLSNPTWRARDDREDYVPEETGPWRAAAMRRRVAQYDHDLYEEIRHEQIQSGVRPEETLRPLGTWDSRSLGWLSDYELFKHLQSIGAFSQPGMDTERKKLTNTSDEEVYEQLRCRGARWDNSRKGWFLFGIRMTFDGMEGHISDAEKTFNLVRDQGAFRTVGVARSFKNVDDFAGDLTYTPTDWEIFRKIRAEGAHWDSEKRCWMDDDSSIKFGDLAYKAIISSETVWEDSAKELVTRPDVGDEILDYIDNLWL